MSQSLRYRARRAKARTECSRLGRAALALAGRQVLLAVGDSHLEVMRNIERGGQMARTRLHLSVVPGATASGIRNPNSKTHAAERMAPTLALISSGCSILVCLGEIDVGFLVFLKAERDGRPVRELTDEALQRYQEFLRREVLDRGGRLLMLSASMPTVDNYQSWGGLGGARRLVNASREQRATETSYWNEQCSAWCAGVGGTWLDLTAVSTSPDGHVRPEWLNDDPEDHHLNTAQTEQFLLRKLAREGFR